MWYPVSDAVTDEPVTLPEAQGQTSADETDHLDMQAMLVLSARAHVEAYCNRQFATHAMVWACDGFGDFPRLPAAPAITISSIIYFDAEGDEQTLSDSVYELRADGLNPWIALRDGETWPQIARGSRVRVTGTFGGDCPADVKHAMLLLIGDGFITRENEARPAWTVVDVLLANHRRGAW